MGRWFAQRKRRAESDLAVVRRVGSACMAGEHAVQAAEQVLVQPARPVATTLDHVGVAHERGELVGNGLTRSKRRQCFQQIVVELPANGHSSHHCVRAMPAPLRTFVQRSAFSYSTNDKDFRASCAASLSVAARQVFKNRRWNGMALSNCRGFSDICSPPTTPTTR